MKSEKSILLINNSIEDITDKVQQVQAIDKITGEVKFDGFGIVSNLPNHIHEAAVLFLTKSSKSMIFGEFVVVYVLSKNWNYEDYSEFDMKAEEPNKKVFIRDDKLRKMNVIY